ncbi:MAG: OBAP family protein [Planctomycetes bacterium]|nr:OBAP family protein [Planctomycetota bacterium]
MPRTSSIRTGAAGFAGGLALAAVVAFGLGARGSSQHGAAGEKNFAPVEKIHLYLCAFHVAKENPSFQVEAHHYCSPVSEEVHQCVVFDSKEAGAKLLGVEYIVTEKVYRSLPEGEKKFWHPHAYEILSGQLVAPNLPKEGDEVFPGLITTWGKTFHTWRDPSTAVPIGEPLLMWSANGDGQIAQKLVDKRDAQFGISSAAIRERRKPWGYEVPQIPPPKSLADVGRQWTATGPDEPTKKK